MIDLPRGTPGAVIVTFEERRRADVIALGTCCHRGRPMTPTSPMEAASLSKPVFARLVLELAATESLDVDAPFLTPGARRRQAIDPAVAAITPAMVLTHTTGLPNWRPPGPTLGFESAPGTPGYSGQAFELLLHAMLRRLDVGAALEDLLDRTGMHHSSFVWQPVFEGEAATGHLASGEPVPRHRPSTPRAAGSLWTTALDYEAPPIGGAVARAARRPKAAKSGKHSAFACRSTAPAGERSQAERPYSLKLIATFIEGTVWPEPPPGAIGPELEPARRPDLSSSHTLMWALTTSDCGPVLWQHGDNPGFKHLVATRPEHGDGVLVLTNGDTGWELARRRAAEVGLQLW